MQSHGSGIAEVSPKHNNSSLLMHDRSLDTTIHNQSGAKSKEVGFKSGSANVSGSNSEQLHSILKTTEEGWRRFPSDEKWVFAYCKSYFAHFDASLNK